MAFKQRDPNQSLQEREAENRLATMKMFDKSCFGHEVASGVLPLQEAQFQIIGAPLPDVTTMSLLARDSEGIFTVILRGDRKPDSVYDEGLLALSTVLSQQGEDPRMREGVTMRATGMYGSTLRREWTPGVGAPDGYRGFALCEGSADLGVGVSLSLGRPLVETVALRSDKEEAPRTAGGVDLGAVSVMRTDLVAQDAEIFKGKPLREVSLRLTREPAVVDKDGNYILAAANENGPVALRIPANRANPWSLEEGGSFDAFTRMHEAMQKNPDMSPMTLKATGAFFRHTLDDNGVLRKKWEFVAATVSFSEKGKEYVVGRPVEKAQPEVSAPAVSSKKVADQR